MEFNQIHFSMCFFAFVEIVLVTNYATFRKPATETVAKTHNENEQDLDRLV